MEPGRWLDPERKQETCKSGHDWSREERQEGSNQKITPLSRTEPFVLALPKRTHACLLAAQSACMRGSGRSLRS